MGSAGTQGRKGETGLSTQGREKAAQDGGGDNRKVFLQSEIEAAREVDGCEQRSKHTVLVSPKSSHSDLQRHKSSPY